MGTLDQVYTWKSPNAPHSHAWLLPKIEAILASRTLPAGAALDYGCGNGVLTHWLTTKGFKSAGVDLSDSGVAVARAAYPSIPFSTDVTAQYIAALGPFDLGICIEVIAHCSDPTTGPQKIFENLKPGGQLILATPYYGYTKDLVLAVTGRLKDHIHSLAGQRYLHFFTIETITQLLREVGFVGIEVYRVGRIPPLAMSMVVAARKPGQLASSPRRI